MKKFDNRNLLTPQMKEYSKIGENWMPFIMFIQKPNHRSTVVNTDCHGFRFNYLNNKKQGFLHFPYIWKIVIGNKIYTIPKFIVVSLRFMNVNYLI